MPVIVIQIALGLGFLLDCFECIVPGGDHYLPLGHSHLAQTGLMLGAAVAGVGVWEAWSRLRRGPNST